VKECGVKKEKPLELEEDIRELFEILSDWATREKTAKDYLSKTKCVDFRRWNEQNMITIPSIPSTSQVLWRKPFYI
jgi:hypothetical protein